MATKATNDKIASAMKGQAAARKATPAPKPGAKAAAKATTTKAPAAKAARKPGNLKTTGLPNKVRTLRMKAGLTPDQLGSKAGAGLTASFVRRIERGARLATPAQVTAIAGALGVAEQSLGIKDAKPAAAKAARSPRASKATGVVVPADLQVGETVEVTLP